jgi:peptidoglycan/xylan/chitin deacetylase (PgdA/CDA1 family)
MRLSSSVAAKGPLGFAARIGTIGTRFGVGPARMERRLRTFGRLAAECGVSPTFPVTAVVVARNPGTLRGLQAGGVEFAIHGLVHNDHTEMPLGLQRQSIAAAKRMFEQVGLGTVGFRAPYLRANDDTLLAVRDNGLVYDCSRAVAFPVLPGKFTADPNGGYARALRYYRALDSARVAVRPRLADGLVRIPVTVPDDEIMVDRLHLTAAAQTEAWSRVLDQTYDRGDLFTIQLHPERIDDCRLALGEVLADARRRPKPVWFANLRELADWWARRAEATMTVARLEDGIVRVTLRGGPDVRLALRPAKNSVAAQDEAGVDGRVLRIATSRLPVVGIPASASVSVAAFLREEGYIVNDSARPDEVGAFVDVRTEEFDEMAVLRQIAKGPGPVVRISRWPQGRQSAVAITGDIDALTLRDFGSRYWETRRATREAAATRHGGAVPRSQTRGSGVRR